MINITEVKNQILLNINRTAFENVRKSALKDRELIGGYAYEISCAVLLSDLRMYKREIYAYNGKFYEQFDFAQFHNMIIDILLSMNVGMAILVKNNIDVVDFCKKRLIQKDIDPIRTMIPFQNYILDTETFITYPHSPKLDLLYVLPYDYDPDADCPIWKKFLKEVLPSDGLIEVLQEYLGLLFVGRDRLKLEKMLILLGTGANGKSVVFETLIRILGESNVSLYDMAQLTRGKSSEANLADIDGKMLNYASDLDPHDFSGGIMKRLISGEEMQARKLYKDPMKLKVIPLFIANANELPETTDRTKGFFRRMLIIPFEITIKEENQDKALSTKLRNEFPGILNWILEGRARIIKNKINNLSV
jgi:P4 family phage/plasmid primase-like protien